MKDVLITSALVALAIICLCIVALAMVGTMDFTTDIERAERRYTECVESELFDDATCQLYAIEDGD